MNIKLPGKNTALHAFILCLFIFVGSEAFAQFNYKIDGLVKEDDKPLAGAIVSIFDFENVKVKDLTTSATGTWTFSLKADEEYNIFITKPGYINVKIMYSTIGISPADAKKFKGISNPVVEIFPMPADPKLAGQLTATLNKPYLSYYYSAEENKMIGDEINNKPMQEELSKLQRQADGPNAAAKDAAKLQAQYNEIIARADKAFLAKNYTVAKDAYNEALGVKSSEQYPKTKIAEIDKTIGDAAAKEKADKDKALADAAEKERLAKEKAEKDKALADAAAKAKADKDKAAADAAEKDRLAKEQAAKTKAEQDKALADAAAKAKAEKDKALADAAEKERLAKEKIAADAAERDRLAKEKAAADAAERDRLAKEKADKDAAERERLAKEKAIADEKAAADKAAKEKAAAELAAKEKAEREKAEAEAAEKARIAKEKADKEKAIADAAEKERLAKEEEKRAFEKKYRGFITKGDSALLAKNYPVAKTAYNDAAAMKPDDAYHKEKLKQIDTDIANADLFKNDLAKKYPLGVTEEKVKEGNNNITRRIVVTGNKGVLYIKKETSFGTVYYFKDGAPITEQLWDKETVVK
ncbi:MAG: Tetratricopeptide 1 repeat-containing protein [Bacteroidota bacterium]|jgi:hypothetical protein|nr:Tetratricopeptide 1 repeat-containing protein [Bacteroidota bacterium]